MTRPERHALPDGTPVFALTESPCDESGVDVTLVDEMLGKTPSERLAWLEETLALVTALRAGLRRSSGEDGEEP